MVTSTFASVNPLFFNLYSFFDGPGSKSNDTFYSSDTNGSYAQQSFYDVLTNKVNNSTVRFFLFFLIYLNELINLPIIAVFGTNWYQFIFNSIDFKL